MGFIIDVLGINPWSRQEEIVSAVSDSDRNAIRSGHGCSKTHTVASLVLWFTYAVRGIVLTTAPTWRQVESVLWREIAKQHRGAKKQLHGQLSNTQLKLGDDAFALGLSTNEPERFQGYHAPHVMVVEDEAPGVKPLIHNAIEGVLSGGGKWLKIGNPTESSGPFYECFRSPGWGTLAISCLEHPNVVTGELVIPGGVTREWVEQRKAEWGEESPLYQSRVLGEFPTEGDDTLIRLSWVEQAFQFPRQENAGKQENTTEDGNELDDTDLDKHGNNPVPPSGDTASTLVCDVARFGSDETVIGLWQAAHYTELIRYNGKDLMQTVGHIITQQKEHKPQHLVVDDDGLGGGVTDRLREQGHHVNAFNGGGKARDTDDFLNKRAEAWWALREGLRKGEITIDAPDGDGLKNQLTALKYEYNSKGQIKIESKDAAKKRGVRSPDRADTMAMGLAPKGAALWEM